MSKDSNGDGIIIGGSYVYNNTYIERDVEVVEDNGVYVRCIGPQDEEIRISSERANRLKLR